MSVAAACFKWADVLENQFDKSWVELDTILCQLEDDEGRRAASSLASCFSQFAHKSTTVFQTNAKMEAELLHLREELAEARGLREAAERERQEAVRLLQEALRKAAEAKMVDSNGAGEEIGVGKSSCQRLSEENSDKDTFEHKNENGCEVAGNGFNVAEVDEGERKISEDFSKCAERRRDPVEGQALVRLLLENKRLRAELLELESEMVGARLDNVYLDKELAGRIQQIQLLLATKTPADRKEKMWSQIESEMCLQRSKTIAQMCKTKQEVKCRMREESSRPLTTSAPQSLTEDQETETSSRGKQAMILKNPADDLGMAIIGGREHNLPIIISEIFPGTAVARSNRINAGDIILSVNGESFSEISHQEAVTFLGSLRFYKIFDPAVTKEGVDAVSVSLESSRRGSSAGCSHPGGSPRSHPGRAVARLDLDGGERVTNGGEEIPSVHSSPRRAMLHLV